MRAVAATIRVLDPVVADAIAAGEVIERPASVVKELCENALDAGATQVDVVIDGGGLVRIRVADDGHGITADQLPLATMRHATSKITAIDDLWSVTSLGFRGEALASIASVADLTITSAPDDDGHGARIRVRGGDAAAVVPAGRMRGTTVDVCDLFFNTPARLRFLRTERAESAAAVRVVGDLMLTHPHVAFTCTVDDRVVLNSSGEGLDHAARAVFGPVQAAELIPLDDGATTADGVRVGGLVSQPRAHRGTRSGLVVVVNGRRVHNRSLLIAVGDAYRGLVPANRHPFGVVVVDTDPAGIDVNVHPAKREVRFREESRVFVALQRACWQVLRDAATYVGDVAPDSPGGARITLSHVADAGDALSLSVRDLVGNAAAAATEGGHDRDGAAPGPRAVEVADGDTAGTPFDGLVALGQAGGEWIVAAGGGRVVLIDPHAAHEKVLYQRIIERWQRGGLRPGTDQMQLLLIPALIECDPSRMATFEANRECFDACGFDIDVFGPGTLRCRAVPAGARTDAEVLVAELLDGLGDRADDGERRHRVAALIACHSAIRFGDRVGAAEQQALLTQLAATKGALTCPHGRPTVMILDDAALRRAFRRPV